MPAVDYRGPAGSQGAKPALPFGADLRAQQGPVAGGPAAAIASRPCADRGRRLVEATKLSALAFKWGPPDLREDREVVLAVVAGNWRALEHAAERFRADRAVVEAAVAEGGEDALRLAACELRRDRELKEAASRAASRQLRRSGPGPGAPPPASPAAAPGAAGGGAAAGLQHFAAQRVAPAVQLMEVDGPGACKEVPLSYAWLEGGSLELQAPRDLGAPAAELLRPGEEHGPGVENVGQYLRLSFPGSKLCGWSRGSQVRLPVPYGTGKSLQVKMTSEPKEDVGTVEERRMDPEDNLLCTLAQLKQKYAGTYSEADILQYWDLDCEPLDEQLWIRHEEVTTVSWAVRPSTAGFRCSPAPSGVLASQATLLACELQERGWGVVDGFLQASEADAVQALLRKYWSEGRFKAGMIGIGIQKQDVRGDMHAIGELGSLPEPLKPVQQRVQQLVAELARSVDRLHDRGPVECEPPMMAVYPGGGACYKRHFDGLEGTQSSGLLQPRVCTLISYFNPFWCEEHGGQLRLYPDAVADAPAAPDDRFVNVDPLHGRLLAFLCQGRNAHEVLPSFRPRFAVTWWVRERRVSPAPWEGLVK